jgi:hypothetical protein
MIPRRRQALVGVTVLVLLLVGLKFFQFKPRTFADLGETDDEVNGGVTSPDRPDVVRQNKNVKNVKISHKQLAQDTNGVSEMEAIRRKKLHDRRRAAGLLDEEIQFQKEEEGSSRTSLTHAVHPPLNILITPALPGNLTIFPQHLVS